MHVLMLKIELDQRVGVCISPIDFLFLPRTEALSNLDPPNLHFLNAAIDEWAASNTSKGRTSDVSIHSEH